MPDFNTEPQGETLRDALLATFTLAQNDLSYARIMGISCAVLSELVQSWIAEAPDDIDGLTLAKSNIDSAHAYFASIDEPINEAP